LAIRIRELTTDEEQTIEKRARSRTEPARLVERAKMVWLARQGKVAPAIGREIGVNQATVRLWLKRFNAKGLAGLQDEPRSGRPSTYSQEQVGEVIATALTDPKSLNLPFGCWTLDRLEAYLNENKGIAMRRTRIDEILIAEGLRWRSQETWFGERVDPDFAEKRGALAVSTLPRQKAAS
jgi:transposase